jgi:hypothetical protein
MHLDEYKCGLRTWVLSSEGGGEYWLAVPGFGSNGLRVICGDVSLCVFCGSYAVLVHPPSQDPYREFTVPRGEGYFVSVGERGINGSMWNVYQARKRKGLSFGGTLPHLIPIILFFGAHYAWLLSPYSHILENNGLMRVSLTMTFVFGRMTTKIILVPYLLPSPYWQC